MLKVRRESYCAVEILSRIKKYPSSPLLATCIFEPPPLTFSDIRFSLHDTKSSEAMRILMSIFDMNDIQIEVIPRNEW